MAYFPRHGAVYVVDGPANDNRPHFDVSGAADGYVIRDGRGHVVRSCATLSNAARALVELRGAS